MTACARELICSGCICAVLSVPICVGTPGPRQLMETEMTTNSPTSRRLTVARRLAGRHRRQLPLKAALASGDSDDMPRAAGLLGERFVQQGQASAAEQPTGQPSTPTTPTGLRSRRSLLLSSWVTEAAVRKRSLC